MYKRLRQLKINVMVTIQSYTTAVILCILTMLCWGSWANTQKMLKTKWNFSLYYWDYSFGVLLTSIIFAITLGTLGSSGRSFFVDITQADKNNIFLALLSGTIFNLANLLLVAAIDIAGMSVAFPISIGLALIIGVVANYLAVPIGNPYIIFLGVLFICLAIIIDAIAFNRKQSFNSPQNIKKGIAISIFSGILMGFFYRFVAATLISDFDMPETGKLTPYTASFLFALGVFLSSFIWNSYLMYKPLVGEKVKFKYYFKKKNFLIHLTGFLGGFIWAVGFILNIIASHVAGYAISYGLGQGATLVAALWGVFIWKEFKGIKNINYLLIPMFLFYIMGLIFIIISRIY